MSIYSPPFLYPVKPQTLRKGLQVTQVYGSTDEAEASSAPDLSTMAAIEQYAPSVARLIAGLTPEEQLSVLKIRVSELKKYKNVPVVGSVVKMKIAEYEARIKSLEDQARAEKQKRMLTIGMYGIGFVTMIGLSALIYTKVFKEIRS